MALFSSEVKLASYIQIHLNFFENSSSISVLVLEKKSHHLGEFSRKKKSGKTEFSSPFFLHVDLKDITMIKQNIVFK